MVEIKTLKCDRCDEIFIRDKSEDDIRIVTMEDIDRLKSMDMDQGSKTAYVVFKYTKTGLDLCNGCMKQLKTWLNDKPKLEKVE